MNINSVEAINEVREAYDEIEKKVKEVGEYLGFLNHQWVYESFEIGKNNIVLVAYDYYYDLHDTTSISFPIECLVSDDILTEFKVKMLKEKEEKERLRKEEEEKRIKERELAEFRRLSEKYGN